MWSTIRIGMNQRSTTAHSTLAVPHHVQGLELLDYSRAMMQGSPASASRKRLRWARSATSLETWMIFGPRYAQFPRRKSAMPPSGPATMSWILSDAAVPTVSGRASTTMDSGLIANLTLLAKLQMYASLVRTVCRTLGVGETF